MDGCGAWRNNDPLAGIRDDRRASRRPAAARILSASDLNSIVINGRQLRYLDGNACTEYEEDSDV
jgi:hypothetical protein